MERKYRPMGFQYRMALFWILLVIAGCAPQTAPVTVPRPAADMPENSVFQAAQRAFEAGSYPAALEGYNAFLREATDDRYVDVALYRIGKIYQLTGRDADAMAVFARLRREYPSSRLAVDAEMAILEILFSGGQYSAVVADGTAFAASGAADSVRYPLTMMIADAYAALKSPLDASVFYYRAWRGAEGADADRAWGRLKKNVEQLSPDDIQRLISQVSERRVMGFLLYKLGMAFIMEEKYDDALDVLSAFVSQFPEHKDHQDAADMVMSLIERSRCTPFTIGCILPLSGSYAMFGRRALEGIELAFSQVSRDAADIPFKILVRDSHSDADSARLAVDELNREKVGVIIGPMAAAEDAASAAQAKGIPIMVFTQRQGIADIGAYVFRNFITPEMQVRTLVAYAADVLGIKRFAILYPDEYYGTHYMNLFWDQVIAKDGRVTGVEAYDPNGTDFAQPIKKLSGIYYHRSQGLSLSSVFRIRPVPLQIPGAGTTESSLIGDDVERLTGIPMDRDTIDSLSRRSMDSDDQWHPIVDFEAVFIPDAPKKAGLVIPQLAYYDIRDVYLLGTNLWDSATLLEMSGDYMQNTIVVDGFFAGSQAEDVRQFVAEFQNTYDRTPGIIEALAYDSAMMVLRTLRRAATDSRRELKAALLQIHDFPGVSGKTGFAADGDAEKSLALLRIQGDHFVEVPQPGDAVDTTQTESKSPTAIQ